MTVGEKIRYYRISESLTQKALAKLACISEIAIRKYESEERVPKTEQLQRIAKALRLPITQFLDMESPDIEIETVGDFMNLFYALEKNYGFKLEYDVDENNMVLPESVRIMVENIEIHNALAKTATSDHTQKTFAIENE